MRIITCLVIASLVGCKSQSADKKVASSQTNQYAENDQKDKDGKSNDSNTASSDETPSIPQAITGALLTCATILPPVGSVSSAQIGCRLSDTSGQRIDPATSGNSAVYAPVSVPTGVTVNQKVPMIAERNFDSIFEISSSDAAALDSAVASIVYKVDITNISDNAEVASKTSDKSTVQIEVPRADWVRKVEGAAPYFIDKTTALTWGVDDGKSYTFDEATAHCAALDYVGAHNWRVPSISELLAAHLDEIEKAFPQPENMNIDNTRNGGYISTALTPDTFSSIFGAGNKRLALDFSKPSFLGLVFGDPADKRSLICVHD